jgi:hypothetical protein
MSYRIIKIKKENELVTLMDNKEQILSAIFDDGSYATLTSERLHLKPQTRPLVREGVLH